MLNGTALAMAFNGKDTEFPRVDCAAIHAMRMQVWCLVFIFVMPQIYFLWCREGGSNPHEVALGGF